MHFLKKKKKGIKLLVIVQHVNINMNNIVYTYLLQIPQYRLSRTNLKVVKQWLLMNDCLMSRSNYTQYRDYVSVGPFQLQLIMDHCRWRPFASEFHSIEINIKSMNINHIIYKIMNVHMYIYNLRSFKIRDSKYCKKVLKSYL